MLSLGEYVERNYQHLFTWPERAAWKHLALVAKSTHGMSPEEAERELREHPRPGLLRDPEVLALVAKGRERFLADVAERILREHPEEVVLNRCPECGHLTRTPRAKLCVDCGHAWHHAPAG